MKQLIIKFVRAFGYELRKLKDGKGLDLNKSFDSQKYLLSDLDQDKLVIFDAGANIGQTAMRYRDLFPKSRIYSFEPFPDSFKALKEATSGDDRITCVNAAVSNIEETKTLYINEKSGGNSLLPRPKSDRRYYPKASMPISTVQTNTITLDNYVRQNNIERVDILKMDVQGWELFALKGAKELLSSNFFPVIYTEIMFVSHYENGVLMHQIWSYLLEFGYSLFGVYNLYRGSNGQFRQGNAIFISDKLRRDFIDRQPEEP